MRRFTENEKKTIKKIRKFDPDAKIIVTTADLSSEIEGQLILLKVGLIYKPYEIDACVELITKLAEEGNKVIEGDKEKTKVYDYTIKLKLVAESIDKADEQIERMRGRICNIYKNVTITNVGGINNE